MVVVTVGGESYYMNPKLKARWDKIKDGKLTKIDDDRVYVVDGREGCGKSVFALQQACYIDPSLVNDPSRIVFGAQQILDAIRKNKSTKTHTKVIIADEAFRGLSSKGALSKSNKKVVQAMMEMRQNNLVLFLVTPSFYLLELYSAVLRSHGLFHIVKDKNGNGRSFRAFNYKKKNILYQRGVRKGWGYNIGTRLRDRFFNKYPGGKEFEATYREMKHKAIRNMDEEEIKKKDDYMTRFALMCKYLKEKHDVSYRTQIDHLKEHNLGFAKQNMTQLLAKIPKKSSV